MLILINPYLVFSPVRTFKKKSDPILLRAKSLGPDWYPIYSVGISPTEGRVLFYFGLLLIGTTLILPTVLFGLDPLFALGALFERFGVISVLIAIGCMLFVMPLVHEALHLVFHPDVGRSNSTIVGGNFVLLFVIFDGPMTRNRMTMYLLAPLLGILMLLLGGFFLDAKLWPILLVLLATHLAMCQGDILLLYKLLRVRRSFNEVWNCGTVLMAR